jgi:hypothetical protein
VAWHHAAVRYWPESLAASRTLGTVSPAERDWHLAGALAWWGSGRVRRRRRLLNALLFTCAVGSGLLVFGPGLDGLPAWAEHAAPLVLCGVGHLVTPWTLRSQQRAVDEAGEDVLSAAGLDPVAVARAALGHEPRPRWWKRPYSRVPVPQERIAAAEGRGRRPAPPLH